MNFGSAFALHDSDDEEEVVREDSAAGPLSSMSSVPASTTGFGFSEQPPQPPPPAGPAAPPLPGYAAAAAPGGRGGMKGATGQRTHPSQHVAFAHQPHLTRSAPPAQQLQARGFAAGAPTNRRIPLLARKKSFTVVALPERDETAEGSQERSPPLQQQVDAASGSPAAPPALFTQQAVLGGGGATAFGVGRGMSRGVAGGLGARVAGGAIPGRGGGGRGYVPHASASEPPMVRSNRTWSRKVSVCER